jgi:hypothetical protein
MKGWVVDLLELAEKVLGGFFHAVTASTEDVTNDAPQVNELWNVDSRDLIELNLVESTLEFVSLGTFKVEDVLVKVKES